MQTNSAEIFGDDVLIEILLRLPIKSLIHYKLVSKQWHSIITNPIFCHLRSCRKTKPAFGLFLHSTDFSLNESFDFVPFYVPRFRFSSPIDQRHRLTVDFSPDINVVQSCNGLLLCRDVRCPYDRTYYVCNPTTKHSFRIPQVDETMIKGMGLAFDPPKSPHYNVVCVHRCQVKNRNLLFQIQIYSSETGSWRICGGGPFLSQANYGHPVYWRGSVHWMGISPLEFSYFNIDRQVLDKMPLPPIDVRGRTRYNFYFGESSDHLHFIAVYRYEIQFDVYEMERDYSKWFVKYRINLSSVVASFPKMILDESNQKYYFFKVLYLVRGEKEPFLVLQILKKVVRYNLVSMTFQVLHEFVTKESVVRIPSVGFQYIESLSCV